MLYIVLHVDTFYRNVTVFIITSKYVHSFILGYLLQGFGYQQCQYGYFIFRVDYLILHMYNYYNVHMHVFVSEPDTLVGQMDFLSIVHAWLKESKYGLDSQSLK